LGNGRENLKQADAGKEKRAHADYLTGGRKERNQALKRTKKGKIGATGVAQEEGSPTRTCMPGDRSDQRNASKSRNANSKVMLKEKSAG